MREDQAEQEERRIMAEMTTTPSSNGEAPLPRRTPKGLLPSTWTGHTVRLEYIGTGGEAVVTTAALLELFPFGPVVRSREGEKFALSWERLTLVELVGD